MPPSADEPVIIDREPPCGTCHGVAEIRSVILAGVGNRRDIRCLHCRRFIGIVESPSPGEPEQTCQCCEKPVGFECATRQDVRCRHCNRLVGHLEVPDNQMRDGFCSSIRRYSPAELTLEEIHELWDIISKNWLHYMRLLEYVPGETIIDFLPIERGYKDIARNHWQLHQWRIDDEDIESREWFPWACRGLFGYAPRRSIWPTLLARHQVIFDRVIELKSVDKVYNQLLKCNLKQVFINVYCTPFGEQLSDKHYRRHVFNAVLKFPEISIRHINCARMGDNNFVYLAQRAIAEDPAAEAELMLNRTMSEEARRECLEWIENARGSYRRGAESMKRE